MKKSAIITQLVIAIAIVVVANLISRQLYFRIDRTEDKRYTLSKATKDILRDLNDVITVKAYFTDNLPTQLSFVQNDLRDQLIEYEDLSGGNLVFEFVNPNESDELKQEAIQNGVAPLSISVVENDQQQQIQAFLGLVLKSGDRSEAIPVVQPEGALEYDLTTAIKKLSILDKPKIGMISGYGEPGINAFPQFLQQLSVLYDVESFNIADTFSIPSHYRALIWVAPKDTIPSLEFAKLDTYINQGGKLFLAYSSVQGDLQQSSLQPAPDIGLKSWIGSKGLIYGNQFVIDPNCAAVTVQQRQGFFTINSQVNVPFFPRISNFEEHPVTKGLEALLVPFTNGFTINNADTTTRINPLIFTSERSGSVPAPGYIDIRKQWTEADFPLQEQILASSIENLGAGNGAIVVIGNGDFIVNGEGQQAQAVNQDNVNFASNAVDWLADDTGLIELRTKGITARQLDKVEDGTKNLLKYGNVFAPIVLLLLYAFIRKQLRNRRKQRWREGNYA